MIELDHLAVAGETLEEAREAAESALGISLQPGGEHAVFHTHNAVIGLEDGLYLEAISINPRAPAPDRPRWFDLDRFSGPARLTNWICRTDVIVNIARASQLAFGDPVSLQRGDMHWQMTVPETGILPYDNAAPAVIEWGPGTVHPATTLPASGLRLRRLTILHPEAATLEAQLAPLITDDRLAFESGPQGFAAEFDGPNGSRLLSPLG